MGSLLTKAFIDPSELLGMPSDDVAIGDADWVWGMIEVPVISLTSEPVA